jgi:tetratricopeptide (TPR) repeat protein
MTQILLNTFLVCSFGFITFISGKTFAKEVKVEESANTTVLMRQFLDHLKQLKKYSMSEDKFKDPKNNLEISTQLHEFVKVAKAASHDPLLKHENFKFSRQVLENHISETENVFKSGNKAYARWMLNSTMSVCMSCHSQMPGPNRSFFEFEKPESYFSEFEQAEFLFATRNFEEASKMYDKIINKNLKFDVKFQVEKSLERQVAYYSRIKRDPTGAIKQFKKYLKVQNLSESSLRDIKSWLEQFQKWEKQEYFDARKSSESEIISFAKKNLDPNAQRSADKSYGPDLVTHLYVSGVLYEYLYSHSEVKSTPDVLYWLAISDRFVNNNFFYSLADMYLRECMIKYPTHPVAKSCYSEYEKEMILSYSGSRGTQMPTDITEDLKYLKNLVNGKGK